MCGEKPRTLQWPAGGWEKYEAAVSRVCELARTLAGDPELDMIDTIRSTRVVVCDTFTDAQIKDVNTMLAQERARIIEAAKAVVRKHYPDYIGTPAMDILHALDALKENKT